MRSRPGGLSLLTVVFRNYLMVALQKEVHNISRVRCLDNIHTLKGFPIMPLAFAECVCQCVLSTLRGTQPSAAGESLLAGLYTRL